MKNTILIFSISLLISCLAPPRAKMEPPKVFAPLHYVFKTDVYKAAIRIMQDNPNIFVLVDSDKHSVIDIRTGKCDPIDPQAYIALKTYFPCQIGLGGRAHSHVGKQWKIVEDGVFKTRTKGFGEGQNLIMPTGTRKEKIEYFTGDLCIYAHNELLLKQRFENWDADFIIYYFPSLGVIYFDPDELNHDEGHSRDIVIIKTLPFDGFGNCDE